MTFFPLILQHLHLTLTGIDDKSPPRTLCICLFCDDTMKINMSILYEGKVSSHALLFFDHCDLVLRKRLQKLSSKSKAVSNLILIFFLPVLENVHCQNNCVPCLSKPEAIKVAIDSFTLNSIKLRFRRLICLNKTAWTW